MLALVLALSLAGGPAPDKEDRLPRSLSETFEQAPAPVEKGHEVLVGIHVGAAAGIEAAHPAFLAGFEWRIHFLPWLAAGGSVDAQRRQEVNNGSGTDWFEIPIMWSVLLTSPVDLAGFRPYASAGGGFTVTHISDAINHDGTDLNLLYFFGFGADYRLAPNLLLNVDARYVWANDPAGPTGFGTDWKQVTVGVLVELPH